MAPPAPMPVETAAPKVEAPLDPAPVRLVPRVVTPDRRRFTTAEPSSTSRDRSFFSGHSSTAFTSAGLVCSHHLHFKLFGGGAADALACVTALLAAGTTGMYVFEEALHTVVKPPFLARGRLGHAFTFRDLTLGAFGDVIENPGRSETVVRVGPTAGLQISDHLDPFAAFAFVVASQDTTGLTGGDLGTLGVRYRRASGEPVPLYLIP